VECPALGEVARLQRALAAWSVVANYRVEAIIGGDPFSSAYCSYARASCAEQAISRCPTEHAHCRPVPFLFFAETKHSVNEL